jgi:isoleucyl-tRNA synthetase
VVATGSERAAIDRRAELVREELNVHALRCGSQADELAQVEVKPNYRTLGPRFSKQMPLVAAAIAGLDAAHAASASRNGQSVSISVAGHDHELGAEDLLFTMKPLEGYQVEREGQHAVALELEIDDELRAEGWARDIVRVIQNARRDAGFEVSDRIALTLDGDERLLAAARAHQDYITSEVLATSVDYGAVNGAPPVMIDGAPLKVAVALA